MKDALVIPLEFWQDPVNDVILIYSERQCSVYFACWEAAGVPADFIGHVSFEHASDVHSARREHPPYRIPEHGYHSFILEVPDSDFVRQYVTFRNLRSPLSRISTSDRHHYVVIGHDIYHEIVAASFTTRTIPNKEVTDTTLRALITAA
jgi:hypothetical protein